MVDKELRNSKLVLGFMFIKDGKEQVGDVVIPLGWAWSESKMDGNFDLLKMKLRRMLVEIAEKDAEKENEDK